MTTPGDPRDRALDDAARALPREIAPPPELLARVTDAIAARRVRVLPRPAATDPPVPTDERARASVGANAAGGARATGQPSRVGAIIPRRLAAAAAIFVVGLIAGATGMLVRNRAQGGLVATTGVDATITPASATGAPRGAATATAATAQFASYERAAGDLATLLASQRATLRPETIAVIERSLARIDEAIADVRTALARDPANAALADAARRLYEQKLDVLKRSTALARS
ncbi:MAG: hypothetical protein HY275_16350 [Gemmatimonadetes bacterium]|nr:hypothetical protein [Gemmatimonadota bacterium]